MNILPTHIERDGANAIVIQWNDGGRSRYEADSLRQRCPCATCREKQAGKQQAEQSQPRGLPVLSLAEAQPLRIEGMHPVGNYAYNISFSDGHDSGIFTFEYLREIGPS